MKANIIDLYGKAVGQLELNDAIFSLVPRKDFLSTVVRWQLARRQAGTHDTKERGEINRTKKKAYRQKGTGNARHGAKTANIFRGGGVVFGPTPRSHAFKLNKKFRKLALCSLLSLKVKEENLIIVKDLDVPFNKTSELKTVLNSLGIESGIFMDSRDNLEKCSNFSLACSNLHKINFLQECGLNVYDALHHEKLILTEDAVNNIHKRLILG